MLLSSTVVSKDEVSAAAVVEPMNGPPKPNVDAASVEALYVARRVIPPRPAFPLLPSSMLHIIRE
jgi:hypothetical protein